MTEFKDECPESSLAPLNVAAQQILSAEASLDVGYLPILNLLFFPYGELADFETQQCFLAGIPGNTEAGMLWILNHLEYLEPHSLMEAVSEFLQPEEFEGLNLSEASHLAAQAIVHALHAGNLQLQ